MYGAIETKPRNMYNRISFMYDFILTTFAIMIECHHENEGSVSKETSMFVKLIIQIMKYRFPPRELSTPVIVPNFFSDADFSFCNKKYLWLFIHNSKVWKYIRFPNGVVDQPTD